VLFILINFTDTAFTNTKAEFEDKFADTEADPCGNCTGPGGFRAFYYEMSYGLFNVVGSVEGPFTAGGATDEKAPATRTYGGQEYARGTHGYYGCGPDPEGEASCDVGNDGFKYAALLAKEAVLAADAAGVNFSQVDHVVIVHQGLGKSDSGDDRDIWPHQWRISEAGWTAPNVDGVTVDAYAIVPERVKTGLFDLFTTMTSIGTPAHEFGHLLGLPDEYDDNTAGIGEHGLMGSCNYLKTGGVRGDTPCHMGPWDKWALGWLKPRRVTDNEGNLFAVRSYEIPDYATHDFALLLEDNPNGPQCGSSATGRYFLVVNRQGTGFDASLTKKVGTTGLQIWRVEEDRGCGNRDYPNGFLTIMEADGNNSLVRGTRLQSGDFWRGGQIFNDTSTPSSRLVDGTSTNVCVTNIGVNQNPMRAGFSEGPSEGTDSIGCPIARTKKILFYEGHAPAGWHGGKPNSLDNPSQTILDLYSRFARELYSAQGYEIHQKSEAVIGNRTLDCLGSTCGVVVIALPTASFGAGEIENIQKYVGAKGRVAVFGDSNLFDNVDADEDTLIDYLDHNNKTMIESTVNWLEAAINGGLLIIGEWGGWAKFAGVFDPSNQLAKAFGLTIEDNVVWDSTFNDSGWGYWPEIAPPNAAIMPVDDYVTYASATVSGGSPLVRANESGQVIVFSASEYNDFDLDPTKPATFKPIFEQSLSVERNLIIPQARVNPSGPIVAAFADMASSADLALTKVDSPDPVAVASPLTYTITVTNNGPNTATGVTLTDTLPENVSFVSAVPNTCSTVNRTVTCNLGSLAKKAKATVKIVVIPLVEGTLENTASVTGAGADTNASNNSVTIMTTVAACGGVTVSSSPASVTYRPTATRPAKATIRVTVRNDSDVPQTVRGIEAQVGEPFTIVSISPALPRVISNKRSQVFSVLTERAAGTGQATATRPYFNTTLDCGVLTTASEPRLLVPLQLNNVQVESRGGQLRVEAEGVGIASVQLQLYNLAGQLILDQESQGDMLTLPAKTAQGRALANGVYLYVVRVRGFNEEVYVSEVRKLVIVR
jgi:M6 family metalloprotease-like protein/uncharacterized repeat protein (TIGR01451 family)